MSAASRTVDVPELLEHILLQLPMHDLLLAQRVDKTFRNATETSCKLQCKLFFKSCPPKDGGTVLNPLLAHILDHLLQDPPLFSAEDLSSGGLLTAIKGSAQSKDEFLKDLHYISKDECVVVTGKRHSSRKHVPSGSWKKMLVADPPCVFEVRYTCTFTSSTGILIPQNADELMEAISKRIESHVRANSGV